MQQLTSLFAESIHRLMHRTLTLHPRGWHDRSALSCWPWGPLQRSTCLSAIIAVMGAVEHHQIDQALVSFAYVRSRSVRTDEDG